MTNKSSDESNLLLIVLKNRKVFLITGAIALVLSVIFSGPTFIPPKFESRGVIYPANIEDYSNESSTEQLLQHLESNVIRDSIIQKLDLVDHYDIDTSEKGGKYKLHKEFSENTSISKTKFQAVELEVTDENPKRAKQIAEGLINYANHNIQRLNREKIKEKLIVQRRKTRRKKAELDSVGRELQTLRNDHHLLNFVMQSKEVTEGVMEMYGQQNNRGLDQAMEMFNALSDKGGELKKLEDLQNLFATQYHQAVTAYDNILAKYNREYTYTTTVVEPEVPDKKSYPIRWLIVVFSVAATAILTFLVLVMKNVKP